MNTNDGTQTNQNGPSPRSTRRTAVSAYADRNEHNDDDQRQPDGSDLRMLERPHARWRRTDVVAEEIAASGHHGGHGIPVGEDTQRYGHFRSVDEDSTRMSMTSNPFPCALRPPACRQSRPATAPAMTGTQGSYSRSQLHLWRRWIHSRLQLEPCTVVVTERTTSFLQPCPCRDHSSAPQSS